MINKSDINNQNYYDYVEKKYNEFYQVNNDPTIPRSVKEQKKMDESEKDDTPFEGGEEKAEESLGLQFSCELERLSDETYNSYEAFLNSGVSREQARMILPVNLYTEWYWKIDLHNLFQSLAQEMYVLA